MTPREPREPEGNRPGQDSPYEDTTSDKIDDTTQGLFVTDDERDDRDNPNSKDKKDDFYKPFQHQPGTGADNVPGEGEATEDLSDNKHETRDEDRDY